MQASRRAGRSRLTEDVLLQRLVATCTLSLIEKPRQFRVNEILEHHEILTPGRHPGAVEDQPVRAFARPRSSTNAFV